MSEQEAYEIEMELLIAIGEKFNSQHNETILLLHYLKLVSHSDESAEKWMVRLSVKATECKYKEWDRRLIEQFINGIDDLPWHQK